MADPVARSLTRGPSGAANPPPDWLHNATLPTQPWPRGTGLFRIHRAEFAPVFFSPGAGRPPLGRFDSAAGRFGVLYGARDFACAFAETVLRNPQRRLFSSTEVNARALSVLTVSRDLNLVRLHGPGLQQLGLDNAITTGPYPPCGLWADALHDHPSRPDGLAYASRFDPETLCIALFERSDFTVSPQADPVKLAAMPAAVASVLRRYAKGLDN